MEEKKINQISLANCDLDEVEIVLGDRFELKIVDGKYYAVRKKPIYPKTYEECCEMLNVINTGHTFIILSHLGRPISSLAKLIIIRDAYWKIAGEQMGLGKPWEPDFSDNSPKHNILNSKNKVMLNDNKHDNRILTFPTIEMRNAFYENFKDLIEQCKEFAYQSDDSEYCVDAPTISQVLEWLRKKDIMVEIIPSLVDDGTWTFSFRIQTKKFYDRSTKDYTSYEQAALACIEYTINNLI